MRHLETHRGWSVVRLASRAVWALGLLAVLARPLSLHAQPAEAGSVKAALKFPARHPYLAVTPEDVEKANKRAARYPWAKETLQRLVSQARSRAARPLGPLPPKGDTRHWAIGSQLVEVGLGHAFSGEAQLAAWVRDGLLAYADLYPKLQLTNGRCRLFSQSSLYEAIWVESITQAYDLVADSGALSDAERRHVEDDLLRPSVACFLVRDYQGDPRIRDLHYRCYNFQAWHLGAIGLVGLALRDADLADYAVNSRYGLTHLLAHDVRDDGLFWERSVGYHRFVIQALLPWTEAMLHCGVDLYRLQPPGDRSKDEDCHYVTDTSNAPKSLKMMFQAPFFMAFPDLSYMALGDSDRGPLHPDWTQLVAWNRYRSPHLEWLLRRDAGFRTSVGLLHYYRYRYRYEAVKLDGRPVVWDHPAAMFQIDGGTVVADDQGTRQPDRYLLTDAAKEQFTLQWNMTRLEDRGKEERAWLVFQVNPHNPAFRRSFCLNNHLPEVGRRYDFRLEVNGPQAKLFRDGIVVATEPTTHQDEGGRDWRWLVSDLPELEEPGKSGPADPGVWKDQPIGNTGVFRNGCTLLPSSGVAVLRQKAGDFTRDPDATAVSLSYGPYGGGHGHPDKLSIALYAQGRQWVPHYGSMPYETSWKTQWTSHTVSHNTVVVDGTSQLPAGKQDHMWPVDSARQRVIGKLERFDPENRAVSASCDLAYPGLRMERHVRLRQHCVVDAFRVSPKPGSEPRQRQFDYVLHVDGDFRESAPPLAANTSPLGDSCGYQHLKRRASGTTGETASLLFEAGGRRLRIWVVPQGGPVEIILADGLAGSPTERKPVLVIRQRGTEARFLTVVEPVVPGHVLTDGDVRAISLENN